MKKQEVLRILALHRDELAARSVRSISVFGSVARDEAREDSDVDLLVVLSKVEHKRKTAIEVLRALNGLPISKDVVVTPPQEIKERGKIVGDILRPALEEGKIIYEAG